jgi:hypothetical protein
MSHSKIDILECSAPRQPLETAVSTKPEERQNRNDDDDKSDDINDVVHDGSFLSERVKTHSAVASSVGLALLHLDTEATSAEGFPAGETTSITGLVPTKSQPSGKDWLASGSMPLGLCIDRSSDVGQCFDIDHNVRSTTLFELKF